MGAESSLYSSRSFLGSRVACSSLLIAEMVTGERFALCPLCGDGWQGTGEEGALILEFSNSFANFSHPEYCSSSPPLRSNDAPQLPDEPVSHSFFQHFQFCKERHVVVSRDDVGKSFFRTIMYLLEIQVID